MKPGEIEARLAELSRMETICALCGEPGAELEIAVLIRQRRFDKGEWSRVAGSVVWSICRSCADRSFGIAVLTNFDSQGSAESQLTCAAVGS